MRTRLASASGLPAGSSSRLGAMSIMQKRALYAIGAACLGPAVVTACALGPDHAPSAGVISHTGRAGVLTDASLRAAARRSLQSVHLGGYWILRSGAMVLSNPATTGGPPLTTNEGSLVRPGNYTAAIACAGRGSIEARLSVGSVASTSKAICHISPVPFRLHVVATRAGGVTIQIVTLGRERIAISYYLVSNHRDYVGK
jgi:hypothetical protein